MSNMMNKFAEKLQGNDDSLQKGKNAKSSNKERDDMNMDMGMGHDQSEGGMKMGHDQSGTKMNAGRGIANDWKTYENMKK
ncbi:CFC_HP_G0004320.mRNA.1.CDS.1 [Saccharomyces cerevisiae]|nr:CFC_HP_G0004320.mRNA.1.CDS.1 [Saccharomyces cerevisiae]CAI5138337.1 ATV_HP_G0051230.mRNA.1.CDS.1 [Saccharomyces cerevisiae]CAI5282721.1 ADM_HP2_G0038640.mRNA.1.CDS.1 [Saccharomyces cerevisiae]CAI6556802.1 ADM_HP2_G0038640.mRNA.1.CDS.1 [Saccharomyces cerevisiae]CAI6597207.1 ADM_HP1_G0040100.mRNA.1.CDS.1 [Saccharomyces cerevisiae]